MRARVVRDSREKCRRATRGKRAEKEPLIIEYGAERGAPINPGPRERSARARVTRVRVALALEDCAISLPLHSSPTRIDIFFFNRGTCAPPLLNADYSAARSAVAI